MEIFLVLLLTDFFTSFFTLDRVVLLFLVLEEATFALLTEVFLETLEALDALVVPVIFCFLSSISFLRVFDLAVPTLASSFSLDKLGLLDFFFFVIIASVDEDTFDLSYFILVSLVFFNSSVLDFCNVLPP